MKKTLASGLLAITVLSSAITFSAVAAGPTGGASNVPISFDGAAPTQSITSFILNDTTWVSIRDFAEAMGSATVTWSPSTAIVAAPNLTITATVGEQYIIANGRYLHVPDGCLLLDGSVMVPIRALAKAYDAAVTWIPTTKTVLVTTGSGAIAPASVFYNDNDVYWLSRIINAEARGESLAGKIAVGNVVLNRVASPQYPNTVREVIFDKAHGVQFTPAYSGAIYNTPSEESIVAAKIALDGGNTAGRSLFFANTAKCWAAKVRPYEMTIGNHFFFA
ncbi:MAG TPA: copper amine oxidase [Papillibacter sp.]|jgi:N-acetylmuramoyl-L-alanine amidase|nr:copper amine oxidase [Papillibacter sp.]